jgi:phage-related protein
VRETSSRNVGNIIIAIKAVDEASGVMGKIQASMNLVAGQLSQLGGGFAQVGGVIQGFAAGGVAGAAVVAVGEITKGLQDCIKEATASEAVWASLDAAVERSGTAWDKVSTATHDALLAMQKTTTYSDEQLAAALERLMTFGLSYDDAMKALGKTLDFAAAKHMDLESAATLVGKAMDGNTGIMKRYGVDIATTKDQAAALAAAQDAAAKAIKAMGDGVGTWVTNVTAAIGADSQFEQGVASAKDKAAYLIEQFKQGAIDTPQFTTAMQSLGVPLDQVALKGGSAEAVLSKLNEQFGGAAQAAASTYAGIQERLKNATEEVGEKIGTIFLPALASLTEACIPIVDELGKGVDAISAWLGEVAKMPEVQAAATAVGDAFSALWAGMKDWYQFIVDTFGPVIEELIGAFREVWEACSPIIEALGEIWDAITGGMDTGDWLKDFLKLVALFIREEVVPAIKALVPLIKDMADGFKQMADFVIEPINTMKALVIGFLDALHDAFQNFYNWLVGGSLWQDLWNALVNVASAILPGLVTMLTSVFSSLSGALKGIWDQMQTAFNTAIISIQNTLSAGWETIKANAISIWDEVATRSTEIVTKLSDDLTTIWSGIQGMVESVMTGVEETMTGIITNIQTVFVDSFTNMKQMFDEMVGDIQTLWNMAWSNIQQIGEALMALISGDVSSFVNITQNYMDSMGETVASTASDAWNTVSNTISGALDTAASAVSGFWNWLVGGSEWQDGLDLLISVTDQKMAVLAGIVQSRIDEMKAAYSTAMGSPLFGAPAMPESWLGGGAGGAGGAAASPIVNVAPPQVSVTTPITVQVDGATVARTVERRLIANRQLSAWRSA